MTGTDIQRVAIPRRKSARDTTYLQRPFVAWDGEGITDPVTGEHKYVMLIVRHPNGEHHALRDPDGIPTLKALGFLADYGVRYGSAINVIYGGNYDVNMILRDFTPDNLRYLHKHGKCSAHGFFIQWRPGKMFSVKRNDQASIARQSGTATFYDVVSFFQCAFIKACDDYLGTEFQDRDLIVRNKALRSSFTDSDVPEMIRYCVAELANLTALMTELRRRLDRVGLRPSRWDGPGAIAAALLKREGIKDCMADSPDDVAVATRHAYAGGRFEPVRWGDVIGQPAYEYDVNSAYPAALRLVPNLARGRWVRHAADPGDLHFAVYRVRSEAANPEHPAPFFVRDRKGNIAYPVRANGWYWSPEVAVAREWVAAGHGTLSITEVWEFVEDDTADRPFGFITELYRERKLLKAAKDGAHVGIKLALNSLYGKLAQQLGWTREKGVLRVPPFHQLEWAGYTTSFCRAAVYRAAISNMNAIISFETDAVFSSEPLDVPIGDDLGEFECIEFASLSYMQSGVYFADTADGEHIAKMRGVNKGTLTREMCQAAIAEPLAADRVATAESTRFVGLGDALNTSLSRWRTWETKPRTLTMGPQGKRVHADCGQCSDVRGQSPVVPGVWHTTWCPVTSDDMSCQHPIEWLVEPDGGMMMHAVERRTVPDYEQS